MYVIFLKSDSFFSVIFQNLFINERAKLNWKGLLLHDYLFKVPRLHKLLSKTSVSTLCDPLYAQSSTDSWEKSEHPRCAFRSSGFRLGRAKTNCLTNLSKYIVFQATFFKECFPSMTIFIQGSKVTLDHRPGASDFSVGPVNSQTDKPGDLVFFNWIIIDYLIV